MKIIKIRGFLGHLEIENFLCAKNTEDFCACRDKAYPKAKADGFSLVSSIIKIWAIISVMFLLLIAGCVGNNINRESAAAQDGGKMANKIATIETDKGTIKFELYEDKAPITAKNFIELASSGFYDGLTFHRYEPRFVIQGGDPNGDGTGGSGKNIPLEVSQDLTHVKGAVAMARAQDPNSASSQFYITLEDAHFLDGNYAVFGKVIEGMDVVEQLRAGDLMNKVTTN